ncbi:MAG: DUF192 domain-containing protein [Gammaproteobacteria bacterium]|nr:DUF192 domain-containing protein [Gammaproteobacteria bacterium]
MPTKLVEILLLFSLACVLAETVTKLLHPELRAAGFSEVKDSLQELRVVFKGIEEMSTQEEIMVTVEVARTPCELKKGLMFRGHLEEDRGMLFVFSENQVQLFWMKNTFIPFDVLFISKDFEIVSMETHAQPCKREPCPVYRSQKPAIYMLEVNAGFVDKHQIQEGGTVEIGSGNQESPPFLDRVSPAYFDCR